MENLFRSNNVNKFVERPVVVAADCCSNVLCYVNGSSVLAQKNFFVIFAVFSFADSFCNVNTHRTVLCLKENAFFQSFCNFVLAFKVGFAFKVEFVKTYAGAFIGFFYAVKCPVVHFLPEFTDFFVACFPFYEHFFCHLLCFRVGGFWLVFFAF